MNVNGPWTKGSAELNHHAQDEQKNIRDKVVGEGHGLSEEDESRINEDVEDLNDGRIGSVQAVQGVLHGPQQQPQGPIVRWERFLPLRSLKVLLVENDNSTRQVVSALLRNCSYEVTAVANGVQAWSILDDLTNHVDLVLAEVALPSLSGIGLLCKIMNHKACKNIPVIMMSSHDSVGIVFKCLSKGAVDFFVKPIRKNELKNLWQHVWRKFHRFSGSESESESGIRTQKSAKSKSVAGSDNNTGSNDEDNGSIGLNVRDGSDNGSATQSSWTKRAVEVDSPKPMRPWDQSADPPDSTCAQVTQSWPEAFGNYQVPMTSSKDYQEQDYELDNVEMGKDLKIGVPRNSNLQLQDDVVGANKDKFHELTLKKDDEKLENRQMDLNSNKPNDELDKEAVDLMSVIANNTNPQKKSMGFKTPSGLSEVPETKDKAMYDKKEIPSLELSLKRLRDIGGTDTNPHDQIIWRHSDLSAFSRYNSASTAIQASTGNVGSCSPLDNSSEAAKTESMQNFQSNSNGAPPNQSSNGSSNNNMGSTTDDVYTKPAAFDDKPDSKSAVKHLQHSAFQPVQNTILADFANANTILTHPSAMPPQVQIQNHHYHYHHHVHNISQQQIRIHDDLALTNMAKSAPQCGSSNVLNAPVEGNARNQSLNGSASGSNHGSNGQNGSTTAVNAQGTNMESDDGIAGKGGAGGGSGSGSGSRSGVDQNQSAQREAALNKFRQKRKERCFEKKVRYQSRKRLAEQRPRIRGQFVRRVFHDTNSEDADS